MIRTNNLVARLTDVGRVRTGLAVLALSLTATAGQADTVTMLQAQTGVFGASQEADGGAFVDLIQREVSNSRTTRVRDDRAAEMAFDQFDTSLGILRSVLVSYRVTTPGRNSIEHLRRSCRDNFGNCPITVAGSTQVSYGIDIAPFEIMGRLLTDPLPPLDVGFTRERSLRDDDGEQHLANVGATARRAYSGPDLARFIGDGTLAIQPIVQTETRVRVTCTARFFAFDLEECDGDLRVRYNLNYRVEVQYTYDEFGPEPSPVPLPAGLPLLALGMLGFGAIARRR